MNDPRLNAMTEQKLARWEEQLQQLNEELTRAAVQDRPRLPERIFVGVFLPFFAGDEKPAYPQANLQMWVGRVAGNPYREVDVVDPQGQVLFTVPPVYDRTALDPQKSQQSHAVPVAHMVASAQQYSNLSPVMGEQFLREELTKRALVMRIPANVLAHVETWNQIFARYGRPPLVTLPEKEGAPAAGSPSTPASDPGFEMDLM